ncbi:MAG: septum formation family protein [Bifidobacteriaceae bacterium]|jgi:hypothetical protein|nr:septum formation family protein [Bifidobacteriaceae bacterium]
MKKAIALTVALAAGLGLAGCGLFGQPKEAPRGEDGAVIKSADADITTLKVGDCTGALPEGELTSSRLIPCDDPHYWEVFAETDLPDGEFPADASEQAETFCTEAVVPFMGEEAAQDERYGVLFLAPTKDAWDLKDHSVSCLVGTEEGGLTGSLKVAE